MGNRDAIIYLWKKGKVNKPLDELIPPGLFSGWVVCAGLLDVRHSFRHKLIRVVLTKTGRDPRNCLLARGLDRNPLERQALQLLLERDLGEHW